MGTPVALNPRLLDHSHIYCTGNSSAQTGFPAPSLPAKNGGIHFHRAQLPSVALVFRPSTLEVIINMED